MMGHEHIRNIAMLDNTSISVIVEPDTDMLASAIDLARSLGSDQITANTCISDVDWHSTADAIVIVSPNHTHCELLCELLLSLIHISGPRDQRGSRMPSSA